jgi:hypothetical protein
MSYCSTPSTPTPSPISTATADPPNCDKPGCPSCDSLRQKAGQKAGNVTCPSGHSKQYCKGWNKTACSSDRCGGDYTCDNLHQPKGATGCPNDKNSANLAAHIHRPRTSIPLLLIIQYSSGSERCDSSIPNRFNHLY